MGAFVCHGRVIVFLGGEIITFLHFPVLFFHVQLCQEAAMVPLRELMTQLGAAAFVRTEPITHACGYNGRIQGISVVNVQGNAQ